MKGSQSYGCPTGNSTVVLYIAGKCFGTFKFNAFEGDLVYQGLAHAPRPSVMTGGLYIL